VCVCVWARSRDGSRGTLRRQPFSSPMTPRPVLWTPLAAESLSAWRVRMAHTCAHARPARKRGCLSSTHSPSHPTSHPHSLLRQNRACCCFVGNKLHIHECVVGLVKACAHVYVSVCVVCGVWCVLYLWCVVCGWVFSSGTSFVPAPVLRLGHAAAAITLCPPHDNHTTSRHSSLDAAALPMTTTQQVDTRHSMPLLVAPTQPPPPPPSSPFLPPPFPLLAHTHPLLVCAHDFRFCMHVHIGLSCAAPRLFGIVPV
jgi:hypothetical protein